jgi:hypothetical protein
VLHDVQLASSTVLVELAAILGRIGCCRISDFCDAEMQNWKTLQDKLDHVRGLTAPCWDLVLRLLRTIALSTLDLHPEQVNAKL